MRPPCPLAPDLADDEVVELVDGDVRDFRWPDG